MTLVFPHVALLGMLRHLFLSICKYKKFFLHKSSLCLNFSPYLLKQIPGTLKTEDHLEA